MGTSSCQYLQSTGVNTRKRCSLSKEICPFQKWCYKVRKYEFYGTSEKCKHYKKQEK